MSEWVFILICVLIAFALAGVLRSKFTGYIPRWALILFYVLEILFFLAILIFRYDSTQSVQNHVIRIAITIFLMGYFMVKIRQVLAGKRSRT